MAYVDGARTALNNALCDSTSTSGNYECSAPLPPLTLGVHVLELATWVTADGSVLESEKSPALRVQMVGQSTASVAEIGASMSEEFETRDGVRLRADVLAAGLNTLTDLAVTRDGRVFVLEEAGRVRVIREGGSRAEPALVLGWSGAAEPDRLSVRLCSIALHPEFERSRFVFLAYSLQWPDDQPSLRLVRYREVGDTPGEAAVILDAIPLPSSFDCAGVRVRFGPDGKLYLTVPDDEAGTSGQNLGDLGGKLLRLNPDGTSPSDNPYSSPVFSVGHSRPVGFDWHPESRELWLAEKVGDAELLNVIVPGPDGVAQSFRPALVLEPSVGIGGIAFHSGVGIPQFKGDLFVAATRGDRLLRLRLDPAQGPRIVESERLLQGRFGRIASVDLGSDGSLYFCTANRAGDTDVAFGDSVVRIKPSDEVLQRPR